MTASTAAGAFHRTLRMSPLRSIQSTAKPALQASSKIRKIHVRLKVLV
jgi:hypothetical protein